MVDIKKVMGGVVVAIIVAVVIVLAIGSAALWWWKGMSHEASNPPQQAQVTSHLPQRQPTVDVERLVAQWLNAWISGKVDDVVSLSSEPYYFDNKLILTKAEHQAEYERLRHDKGAVWANIEIKHIVVLTLRELQESGHDLTRDRIFSSLYLTLDDYAAVITAVRSKGRSDEKMIVAVRRAGDGYEIAGMWD